MPRFFSVFIILICFAVILPLAGCSADVPEPVLNSKEDALARAKELLPELVQGREQEFRIEDSREAAERFAEFAGYSVLPQDNTWRLDWNPPTGEDEHISIKLDAGDGSLFYLYHRLRITPDELPKNLLTRGEAEKIAETFVKRHHPEKMASMVKRPMDSEYVSDSFDLDYSFHWDRFYKGIPVNGNYIDVNVSALTGKVTSFECSWNETLPPPEKTVSTEEITERAINLIGIHPLYVESNSGSSSIFPKAELIYTPNTVFRYIDPVSGNPITLYGEKVSWLDAKFFSQEFSPVSAPEKEVPVFVPSARISKEEAAAIAADFFKNLGIEGGIRKSGSSSGDGLPYPEENWHYSLANNHNSPWEDVEVSINTATGKVESFSRQPKEEKFIFPGLELSRAEAQQAALDFLSRINENTDNMVLQSETGLKFYSVPGIKKTTHDFTWVRLVNGVPFPSDKLDVSISRSTGEVLKFSRHSSPVNTFESTQGIISTGEAAAAWRDANPLELCYQLMGNPLKEKLELRLIYDLNTSNINAHTGEIGEEHPFKKLSPYLEKIKSHWAEVPLDLLAQTGHLPAPDVFEPDNPVTRRECLRILEHWGIHDSFEEGLFSPFKDVSINDPDLWTILKAVGGGIIEPQGNLRPDDPLLREDAAVWFVNILRNLETEGLPTSADLQFKDASQISEEKRNNVAIAQAFYLVSADKDGNFRPKDPVTWAELATMLVRVIPKIEY